MKIKIKTKSKKNSYKIDVESYPPSWVEYLEAPFNRERTLENIC